MKKLVSMLLCVILVLSLCCVTASAAENGYLEATSAVNAQTGTVELVLTAAQPLTNATVHLDFNSDYLICTGIDVTGTVSSQTIEEEHALFRTAVSTADTIGTGETVATVHFAVTGGWEETEVTVTVENWNAQLGVYTETAVTVAGTGARFADVAPEQWFFAAVDQMAADGIIKGMDQNHFCPELAMTRASFVTMLGRLEGVEEQQTETRFTDVRVPSYYCGYVAWAEEAGIVQGISQTLFAPENSVTREQMATFLYRYVKYLGQDVTVENPEHVLCDYDDTNEISAFAREAMAWAVDRGIIRGVTDITLEPGSNSTRAQVAVMLYRFFYGA